MLKAKVDDIAVQTMIALLKDGMAPTFIGRGLKAHGLCPPLLRFFSGPILTYEPVMARLFPPWLSGGVVYADRLELVIAENQAGQVGQLAPLADVLAYLYSTTLAKALDETWAPIYGHVAFETMSRHNLLDAGDKGFQILLTYESQQLAESEQEQLLALRRDIRQSVVKFARKRELVWSRADRRRPLPLHTPSFQQVAGHQQRKYRLGTRGAE